jgi:hypothetical protein
LIDSLINTLEKKKKYRFREEEKKVMTYMVIRFPPKYRDNKLYLKDILNEKDGVKFSNAFEQHKSKIKKLKAKKWKFVGSDVGSWLVTGTLAITAVATGYPVWGFAAYALDQVLDAPKLKELPNSIKELITENNKIQKSPVGMLYKIAKKNS